MRKQEKNFLQTTVSASRKAFIYVFIFSAAVNFLMLALPIYSLQVLDRVVSSQSSETLAMLTIVVIGLFVAFAFFSFLRSVMLIIIGKWLDQQVSESLFRSSIASTAVYPGAAEANASQNLRDLEKIKSFLSGPGVTALFDAPWAVLFIIVLYMINFWQGTLALVGGLILLCIGILNEKMVGKSMLETNEKNIRNLQYVDASTRNAQVIEAMGMASAITAKWKTNNDEILAAQLSSSSKANVLSTFARFFRMCLQIAVMATGTLLVINEELTVGGIIACSILSGRALAPFENAIGAWQSVKGAQESYRRLNKSISITPARQQTMDLPTPQGSLSIEKVLYAPPGMKEYVIKGVSAAIAPGESVGVVGPSAAGKSTLAKLIVGVYKPNSGQVRLDGADVYTWNREDFGRHVGYLPQDVELFSGSVRDNIARMQEDASDEDIVKAAQIAGAHDMILHLPHGYDTMIGAGGGNLSAGQRQRIGLARAFFGEPKLLILDEPNSNLDDVGEVALVNAMRNAKANNITTVIIAHRKSILNYVDKVLVMREGAVEDFGTSQEILQKYAAAMQANQAKAKNAQLAAQQKASQAAGAEGGRNPGAGNNNGGNISGQSIA